jgi:hypothetical protein
MKLDSKQMHIVSQLFMAAGKAGHPFDLARFTKEPSYASETMAKLSLHADAQRNDALQSLTVVAMDLLSSVTMPATAAPTPSFSSSPIAAIPAASPAPPPATSDADQKYVGRLR